MRRRPIYVALVIVAVLILFSVLTAACGSDKISEPFRDAPRGASNNQPADVITFPDGFSNFAAKCDGTTRVYSAFHGDEAYAAGGVSPNHPACGGGADR